MIRTYNLRRDTRFFSHLVHDVLCQFFRQLSKRFFAILYLTPPTPTFSRQPGGYVRDPNATIGFVLVLPTFATSLERIDPEVLTSGAEYQLSGHLEPQ